MVVPLAGAPVVATQDTIPPHTATADPATPPSDALALSPVMGLAQERRSPEEIQRTAPRLNELDAKPR